MDLFLFKLIFVKGLNITNKILMHRPLLETKRMITYMEVLFETYSESIIPGKK